jgi:hypothetical protein
LPPVIEFSSFFICERTVWMELHGNRLSKTLRRGVVRRGEALMIARRERARE